MDCVTRMRTPRIELGSTAWKATMLTITPRTLVINKFTLINRFFEVENLNTSLQITFEY